MLNDTRLLTKKEVASQLRITPRMIEKKQKAGDIAFIKIGRRVLYSPAEIQLFISRNTHRITA